MKIKRINIPQWFFPAIVLSAGALIRLVYLGSMPGGFHQDEAFVALNAYDIYREGRDSAGLYMPVYMSSWGDGQSAMYIWLLSFLMFLTGGRWNIYLCRLPQALVAMFTILAVYCLMRRMFNRTAGLWAMFLLAICPWHVMMSRWGLDANLAPGFLMFGLLFFIKGLDNRRFFLLSAAFYGMSLYCYAVIWPIVPILLLLQSIYGFCHKKIRLNKYTLLSAGILFLSALPLLLFVLVNKNILPAFSSSFMTIPKTANFRSREMSLHLTDMIDNFKTAVRLFLKQDTGSVYDVLMPWGLFYDIGRIMIVLGAVILFYKAAANMIKKKFTYEFFIAVNVLCGVINCLYVPAKLHQINSLFIPLVLCEAYGIWQITGWIIKRKKAAGQFITIAAAVFYSICFLLFQRDYYTEYKKLTEAYFAAGVQESVAFAVKNAKELGITTISAEKAAQWPRLLLFTGTLPSEYLEHVEYERFPTPSAFEKDGIHILTCINYDDINTDTIYIIYYIDEALFQENYVLTEFYDWRVAVPNGKLEN